jgi:hypothetical protein
VHIPPSKESRDRVAEIVEERVRELARSEGTDLVFDEDKDGGVQVRVAATSARGDSVDIAVMRLANALLDNPRYAARLTRALGGVRGLSN